MGWSTGGFVIDNPKNRGPQYFRINALICEYLNSGLSPGVWVLNRFQYEGCQKSSWTLMIKASNEPDFDIHFYISLKWHTMTISK